MKVILAGYPKTGTKTMAAALKILGYEVYDYMEHYWYHGNQWKKIMTGEGSPTDFREMYEDVDAVVDTPVFYFWEEIHKEFPDSKIILTLRDDESWVKSWCNQIHHLRTEWFFRMIWVFSPHGWSLHRHFDRHCVSMFGFSLPYFWSAPETNVMMMKSRYRQHNLNVMQNAPKDKLLIYKVKDGWEPLCEFLGKEIPDQPFPRKNLRGTVYETLLNDNKIMQRLYRETIVSGTLCCGLGLFAVYKIYTSGRLTGLARSLFTTLPW